MTDKEIIKALDILDFFDFFNQRAGRELWSDKPKEVQDEDIAIFTYKVKFLREFINRQQAEIENADFTIEQLTKGNLQLQAEIERLKGEVEEKTETIDFLKNQVVGWSADFCNLKAKIKTAKSEAIKEFADELRFRLSIGTWKHKNVLLDDCKWIIDNLVKEMVGEDK